ncbi:MAG: hypothetical protein LQ346_003913 [Caloplaca aetnensis]|nr:MAG: hypothetical protein LQ346_003913 [Caloplaca aetnensis]
MATETALPETLSILTGSLHLALACVPSLETLTPPSNGLSLLDTKNELLLAYLQDIVLFIVLKLRNQRDPSSDEIINHLVSLRLYFEKGVRPLESRLKYQIDKLLLIASEESSQPTPQPSSRQSKSEKRSSSAPSDSASYSENEEEAAKLPVSDLSHRPNLAAFARPRNTSPQPSSKRGSDIYRPPRITPTVLPTTDRPSKTGARKPKNVMLDTFIREELSTAPVAEPSIGADNGLRGREAQKERERKDYEELRLVRLPSEGGKKKKGKRQRERMGGGFEDVLGGAGEGLGEAVKGGGGGKRRKLAGGGNGARVGEAWEKRKRSGIRGLGRKKS